MKKLLPLIIAVAFAGASFGAAAQDKAAPAKSTATADKMEKNAPAKKGDKKAATDKKN